MACDNCGKDNLYLNGITKNNEVIYVCKDCGELNYKKVFNK